MQLTFERWLKNLRWLALAVVVPSMCRLLIWAVDLEALRPLRQSLRTLATAHLAADVLFSLLGVVAAYPLDAMAAGAILIAAIAATEAALAARPR